MLLACLVSVSMFVLFVEAYKLFASLGISGYEPAIGIGLLFISGIFLIAIFTTLPVSLMDCLWPAIIYLGGAWVFLFLQLRRGKLRNG